MFLSQVCLYFYLTVSEEGISMNSVQKSGQN